ncbi:hypothetical protein E2C01_051114 [Portunus trituberculatus]|uniref:Uncharacterized protein n=1 Tax=Portunus trituberculatus TaxID=210409 RepID=A0A5B7GA46_PORTR|nr:hypothetical protein [Portunus trituberculatus]
MSGFVRELALSGFYSYGKKTFSGVINGTQSASLLPEEESQSPNEHLRGSRCSQQSSMNPAKLRVFLVKARYTPTGVNFSIEDLQSTKSSSGPAWIRPASPLHMAISLTPQKKKKTPAIFHNGKSRSSPRSFDLA